MNEMLRHTIGFDITIDISLVIGVVTNRAAEGIETVKFELFDAVELTEDVTLSAGQVVAAGGHGAIVEVFDQGNAYLVELFGQWIKTDHQGNPVPAQPHEPDAFVETQGVALIYPQQLRFVQSVQATVGAQARLLALVDKLPERLVNEVADFAEFLRQKEAQQSA